MCVCFSNKKRTIFSLSFVTEDGKKPQIYNLYKNSAPTKFNKQIKSRSKVKLEQFLAWHANKVAVNKYDSVLETKAIGGAHDNR